MSRNSEHRLLMRELGKIAAALGKTLAPICEVVLHDLTVPERSIVQIENNLSGRRVGGPVTELGLARISNPDFADVVANYANSFPDGREAKSTSIGIRDSAGNYIGALCLNLDVSYLKSIAGYLGALTRVEGAVVETLGNEPSVSLAEAIGRFSAERNKSPRSLSSDERRELIRGLAGKGYFNRRGAAQQVAQLIGGSRSGVYYYISGAGR